MDDPRAVVFPRVIIIIMGILSALLLLQNLVLKKIEGSKGSGFPVARFLISFSLIILYLVFMETVGFYVSAFLFFVAITFVLGSPNLTVRSAHG